MLASRSEAELARDQWLVAKEFPNPSLSLSTTKIPTDGTPAATARGNSLWNRSYDTVVSLSQPFELGGKRGARQAAARAGMAVADFRVDDARRQLAVAVTKAYTVAAQAEQTVAINRASSESLRQAADIAARRFEAGDISSTEKTQIDIAATRFELDTRNAEAGARSTRIALEIMLGMPSPDGGIRLADGLDKLAAPASALMRRTPETERPDVRAATAAAEQAGFNLRLQRAARIPDPAVQLLYERQPPDMRNSVGAGVTFTIPLWHRYRGEILAAQQNYDAALRELQKVRARAAAEIAQAGAVYDAAIERHRRFVSELLPAAEKVRDTVHFAYEHGGASLLELLEAERSRNDIRLAAAQAAADASSARADLEASLNQNPGSLE